MGLGTRGSERALETRVRRSFAGMHAVMVCVFVLTAVSWLLLVVDLQPSLKRYRRATQAARTSHVAMVEQDAAVGDYLLTGDERPLARYVAGRRTVRAGDASLQIAEEDAELAAR